MRFVLRDYQQAAVDHASGFLATAKAGDRRLYSSPTGTGKSIVELTLQARVGEGCWIITPRVEIIRGMLDKRGGAGATDGMSMDLLVECARQNRIATPIRLRNWLLAGEVPAPTSLIIDEGHHDSAETYQLIALLCGLTPAVAFTATPFRGTPQGTKAFLAHWGRAIPIITYPEAADRGHIAIPRCTTVPLVDDDVLEVKGGDFVVSAVRPGEACGPIDDVCKLAAERWTVNHTPGECWDRPTMFSLPSRDWARRLAEELNHRNLAACVVDGESSDVERQAAFDDCLRRRAALCQVRVVSEGVDLPIRRLVDMAPTISPVLWLQQIGRIMRPLASGDATSEYICTNRNLLRHGYLLEGCVPPSEIVQALKEFGSPGKRSGLRVIGLEALGKLRPITVPLLDGLSATAYACQASEGLARVEYFVLVDPRTADPLWARRECPIVGAQRTYGKWARCDPPEDLAGYASVSNGALSDAQAAWWRRSARWWGLDPNGEVSRKNFVALPVLSDLRYKV